MSDHPLRWRLEVSFPPFTDAEPWDWIGADKVVVASVTEPPGGGFRVAFWTANEEGFTNEVPGLALFQVFATLAGHLSQARDVPLAQQNIAAAALEDVKQLLGGARNVGPT